MKRSQRRVTKEGKKKNEQSTTMKPNSGDLGACNVETLDASAHELARMQKKTKVRPETQKYFLNFLKFDKFLKLN